MSATYTAKEFAALLGVSEWAVYEAVRHGNPPLPPIRVGRRILFPRRAVDELLGLNSEAPGHHPGADATTFASDGPTTSSRAGRGSA